MQLMNHHWWYGNYQFIIIIDANVDEIISITLELFLKSLIHNAKHVILWCCSSSSRWRAKKGKNIWWWIPFSTITISKYFCIFVGLNTSIELSLLVKLITFVMARYIKVVIKRKYKLMLFFKFELDASEVDFGEQGHKKWENDWICTFNLIALQTTRTKLARFYFMSVVFRFCLIENFIDFFCFCLCAIEISKWELF